MEKKDYRLASMPFSMCHVTIKRYGETCEEQAISVELWSYYTHVLTIDYHADDQSFELYASGTYSVTTARHINRFTTEFLGENMYHEIKRVCSKSDDKFPLVLAFDHTTKISPERAFFKALHNYYNHGKRFYDYTKSEIERFNAHRWCW